MSLSLLGDSVKAEPNLVPLLDVVMQLLMFFMMCVNFVNEQFNQNIELPVAQSARPPSKTEDQSDVLVLNLDRNGHLEVGDEKPLETLADMRYYLKQQYADTYRLMAERQRKKSDKPVEVKTTVIIRADKSVDFDTFYQLLQLCKEAGYRKLQLRARSQG
jgi:biopolymer transport protein ExbD